MAYSKFSHATYEHMAQCVHQAVNELRNTLDEDYDPRVKPDPWLEGAMYALSSLVTHQAIAFKSDNSRFDTERYEIACCLHTVPLACKHRMPSLKSKAFATFSSENEGK